MSNLNATSIGGTTVGGVIVSNNTVKSSGWIAATNFVSLYNQPTTNGLTTTGGAIGSNGTNWWTIQRDSGGVLTTNKISLTTWP